VRPESISDLPLKDEGDLRLVEAAVSGGASYLITSDREVLLQRGYAQVEFVTPVEFVRLLRKTDSATRPRS
jgi:predicted nucleic acid-binding protein